MNKYQIVEVTDEFNHAGTKATSDVMTIASELGFDKLFLKMRTSRSGYIAKANRQWGYGIDWRKCYNSIPNNSLVLLQHPFHYPQLTREKTLYQLKKKKHVKFISFVHDVEELRHFRYNDYYRKEFEFMLEIADIIVVHNQIMKQFFITQGVDEKKLVNLEIFDYLQNASKDEMPQFENSLVIAGNLDVKKCEYISHLNELQNIKIKLYGPNFDETMRQFDHIVYEGSFPVDQIPYKLNKGYGLVWDGSSIFGCEGDSGQYLKYNNPHKLSLYLSSGLPVIIWENAAEAKFVRENGVGLCVKSLKELNDVWSNIKQDDYMKIAENVAIISRRLQTGYYGKKALIEAELRAGE